MIVLDRWVLFCSSVFFLFISLFSLLSRDLLGFGVGIGVLVGSKFDRLERCWKIGIEAIQDDVPVVCQKIYKGVVDFLPVFSSGAAFQVQLEACADGPKNFCGEKLIIHHNPFVIDALRFDELDKRLEFLCGDAVVAKEDLDQCHECLQLEDHLVVVQGRFNVLLGFLFNFFCALIEPSFLVDHRTNEGARLLVHIH